MEKIKLGADQARELANDVESVEVRTLADLEMVLVGGGDGPYDWP